MRVFAAAACSSFPLTILVYTFPSRTRKSSSHHKVYIPSPHQSPLATHSQENPHRILDREFDMTIGRSRCDFSWEHAKRLKGVPGKKWECRYCLNQYGGSTMQIKNHLARSGNGVKRCEKVPDTIRLQAREIIRQHSICLQAQEIVGCAKRRFQDRDGGDVVPPTVAISGSGMALSVETPLYSTAAAALAFASSPVLVMTPSIYPGDHCNANNNWHTDLQDPMENENMLLDYEVETIEFSNSMYDRAFPEDPLCNYSMPDNGELVLSSFTEDPFCSTVAELDKKIAAATAAAMASATSIPDCTVMKFKLEQKNSTLAFHSPTGLIFAKAPDDELSLSSIEDVCKGLPLSSNKSPILHFMFHKKYDCLPTDQVCAFRGHERTADWPDDPVICSNKVSCLRHDVMMSCTDFLKASPWDWELIKKAEDLHQLIVCKLYSSAWFNQTLKGRGFKELAGVAIDNPLSRFLSIILLEEDIRKHLSCISESTGILSTLSTEIKEALLDDSEFWKHGRQLQRVLSIVLMLPCLTGNMVLGAGYVEMYMKEANRRIATECPPPKESEIFWSLLNQYLIGIDSIKGRIPVVTYLNPAYLWSEKSQADLLLNEVKLRLKYLVGKSEWDQIEKELEHYSDHKSSPFRQPYIQLKSYHPVVWWELYGESFPLLKQYAIQLLSMPVCCMSDQVQKHMDQHERGDSLISKLNADMEEEFRNTGADIFKPFDLSELS